MRAFIFLLVGMLLLPLVLPLRTAQAAVEYRGNRGKSRGYLTTGQELEDIRVKATNGIEPYRSNVVKLVDQADEPWDWSYGGVSGEFRTSRDVCYSYTSDIRALEYNEGGQRVYQKILAYFMTKDVDYARIAREKILDLTDTYGFGGEQYDANNQCIILLAFSIPIWIAAADLMADTPVWTYDDKTRFQNWLREQIYPKVAWASRVRANNWGSSGSLSSSMIADYMGSRYIVLREYAPTYRRLLPEEAYNAHNWIQYTRMVGDFQGDSQCNEWGVQSYGGIPDELRRGSTGCEGLWIVNEDKSLTYQTIHVEHLIFHAFYLLRRGNDLLFRTGHISRAIKFVVANPFGYSRDWVEHSRGALFIAYHYYCDTTILLEARQLDTLKGGDMLLYAPLTNPLDQCRLKLTYTAPPRVSS